MWTGTKWNEIKLLTGDIVDAASYIIFILNFSFQKFFILVVWIHKKHCTQEMSEAFNLSFPVFL